MYNPTDYFIKVLAVIPGSETASHQAIKSICDSFAVSDVAKELDMDIHLEYHLMENENEETRRDKPDKFRSPFFMIKIMWLVYRHMLIIIRDPRVQLIRILQKLAIALTAGLCFISTARLTQDGIQDVQGALFIIIAENTFSPMYSVLHVFPEEFPLFHRELKAGLYSTPIYYIARMIAMFPGLLIEPTLFTLVVYWIAGLRNTFYAFSFTIFIAILVLNYDFESSNLWTDVGALLILYVAFHLLALIALRYRTRRK
ncbi:ABC transporter related-protein [Operophtera brumata]|uniref:ABC transporter related-protein n=1 Tax=Operophtera brumata TaxID=104452 RepID=A0A0L7K561_OPEBR|nr:ABC transporter related-protein [Operophtera brumata]